MKGIRIDPDATVTEVDVNGLESMQAVVDGFIEPVTLRFGVMYCNEDGKMLGLPVNHAATLVAQANGLLADYIVGSVLIMGPTDKGGHDTALGRNEVKYIHDIANAIKAVKETS